MIRAASNALVVRVKRKKFGVGGRTQVTLARLRKIRD
jgi:hypothetical protein